MGINLALKREGRKLLSFFILAVLVATSFSLTPQLAYSNTPVTLPVSIEDTDGAPISDLAVEFCHQGSGEWECQNTSASNAQGIAQLSVTLPNQTGYVQLSAGGHPSAFSRSWYPLNFNRGVADSQPRIILERTNWIKVEITVVNEQGNPVRNEWVQVSTQADGPWVWREWEISNSSGKATFYLDQLRWGQLNGVDRLVNAQVEAWSSGEENPDIFPVTIEGLVGSGEVTSKTLSYSLKGVVTDENGDTLANTDLCLTYTERSTNREKEIDFRTDASGNYTVSDVGNRYVNFQPNACGFIDELLTYDYQNGYEVEEVLSDPIQNVQFKKTGIAVTVIDENGDPASFVQLGLEAVDEQMFDYRRQSVTDQNGVAYFSALEPDTAYNLSFRNDDRPGEARRFQDGSHDGPIVTLERNKIVPATLTLLKASSFPEAPVSISGVVLGSGDAPLANSIVQINTSFGVNNEYLGYRVRTDELGRFNVSGMPYGYVWLEVMSKGHRPIYKSFETTEAKGISYPQGTFRLRSAVVGTLEYSGVLRDTTGQPVADMELVLNNPFESGRGIKKEVTDSLGRFSFKGLTAGHYWMYANSYWEDYEWSNWSFNLTTSRTSASLVIVGRGMQSFVSQASISGSVMEYLDVEGPTSSRPVTDVCLYVYPIDGGTVTQASTDSDGNWVANGLIDGEKYAVGEPTACSGGPGEERRFDYANKYEYPQQNSSVVTARIEGGIKHEWTFKEISRTGSGSISGRVKDADNYSNIAGVTVNIERALGGIVIDPVTTDSRGEYQFNNLPAGDYYINIPGDGEYWGSWMSVEVSGEPNRANIILSRILSSEGFGLPGVISGRVLDELGLPHGSAKIEVYYPEDANFAGYAETDNDGLFEISMLPVDTLLAFKVIPWWSEIAIFISTFIIESSNEKDLGDIDLTSGTSISGQVTNIPQGQEVRTIFAELVDAETGTFIHSAEVDTETGQYVIGQVPAGSYKIRFTQNSRGWFWSESARDSVSLKPVYWDGTQFGTIDQAQASAITVTADQPVVAKNVRFSNGSTVQGTISLSTTSGIVPLTGTRSIWVDLYMKKSNGDWSFVTWSELSARSNYGFQFVGLADGEYKIQFIDSRQGNNSLISNFNGGASSLEDAPIITVGEAEKVVVPHTMEVAPPQTSAEAFDLDDLGAEKLAELKDEISLSAEAEPGSELEVFVGTEFAGNFVSAFANSTPVVLGDWKQVNSEGYITVTIPASLPVGSHRIAVQDGASTVFGWAPIAIVNSDQATGSSTPDIAPKTETESATSSGRLPVKTVPEGESVESTPDEDKGDSTIDDNPAASISEESSTISWLLAVAGGVLILLVAGSAWLFRSRRSAFARH